jgi:hypothetical protein
VNVWDLAATWSARRWLRRLRTQLASGLVAADHDPALAEALSHHVRAVQGQIDTDTTARAHLVPAPYVVLVAIYAEDLHREARRAGWVPPLTWTPDDGVSLRLLACCVVAGRRGP